MRKLVTLLMAGWLLSGCFLFEDEDPQLLPDLPDALDTGDTPFVDPLGGKVTGEACVQDQYGASDCRYGLKCVEGTCRAVGDTQKNYPCITNAECDDGLHCSLAGACLEAGTGDVNAPCTTGADCLPSLYCKSLGLSGYCAEGGTADLGQPCLTTSECMPGLQCGIDDTCVAGNIAFGPPPWPGVGKTVCDTSSDQGTPRFYFEIPRDDVTEFFRLPYPNDIRVRNGTVKLDGFPTPGPGLIGFDPVARTKEAIEKKLTGFSTVPLVVFRYSELIDFATITTDGPARSLRFVNIDPDSPGFGAGQSYNWSVTDGGTKYICPRFLTVSPPWDRPLQPATTYAVILTEGITTTAEQRLLKPDADLELMLSDTPPVDPVVNAAWSHYQVLRDYLDNTDDISREVVIAAAVFTTQEVTPTLSKIRAAVQTLDIPAPRDVTLCEDGAVSPCGALGGGVSCQDSPADVHEIHMVASIPKVQAGTRPYLEPADGGDLAVDANGDPNLNDLEDVCVTLTIPKNVSMPAEGWPLMIYGHGTGGTARSAVTGGGLPLADIDVGGTKVGMAVAGWTGPMHGERRNSELDPETLFFNFANPLAARGNLIQGAADVFALVKTFKALTIPASESPTGEEIRFDPGHFAYTGHSQGSTTGPLAVPYEPTIKLNVWSGAGAGLVLSLLNKTAPVDAKAGVAVALQEITDQGLGNVGDGHPALRLVQQLFDAVDPLNHAAFEQKTPLEGASPQHVLHIYGRVDTYTPPITSETFARVLGLDQVGPQVKEVAGLTQVAPPVSGNRKGNSVTAGVIVVQADGYDGHFVLFQDSATTARYQQFLGTWLVDGLPVVTAP